MAKKENCNLQEDGVWNTIQYSKVPLEAAFSRGALGSNLVHVWEDESGDHFVRYIERKPNFNLSALSFAIALAVHDDASKFPHFRRIPKWHPRSSYSGVSRIIEDSRERAVTGEPFYRWPAVFAKTKLTTKPACKIIRTFSVFGKI